MGRLSDEWNPPDGDDDGDDWFLRACSAPDKLWVPEGKRSFKDWEREPDYVQAFDSRRGKKLVAADNKDCSAGENDMGGVTEEPEAGFVSRAELIKAYDKAAAVARERDVACEERDTAQFERRDAVKQREEAKAERDAAQAACNSAVKQHGIILKALSEVTAERDAAIRERDEAREDRDEAVENYEDIIKNWDEAIDIVAKERDDALARLSKVQAAQPKRQVFLDTETTGLGFKKGDRIAEIALLEMQNRRLTGRQLQFYVNPEREVSSQAQAVNGLSYAFLRDKPKFAQVAGQVRDFIKGAELIMHNAPFDLGFLNMEFARLGLSATETLCASVVDTLKIARGLHPGQENNLNALCSRYRIDTSRRTRHGALVDTQLLSEVYLAMVPAPPGGAAHSGEQSSQDANQKLLAALRDSDELRVALADTKRELDAARLEVRRLNFIVNGKSKDGVVEGVGVAPQPHLAAADRSEAYNEVLSGIWESNALNVLKAEQAAQARQARQAAAEPECKQVSQQEHDTGWEVDAGIIFVCVVMGFLFLVVFS